jgi:hypothetical protein
LIGIIVSSSLARKARSGQKNDVIQFYKKLAANNKVDICFYSVRDLSSASPTVKAAVYSKGSGNLETKQVSVPKVNLYRGYTYLTGKSSIRKIESLRKKHNIIFFNILANSDRGKLKIHKFLTTQKDIAPYLPDTETLTFPKMVKMADLYGKLYIKPKRSAKGRNIRVLEKTAGGYKLTYVNNAKESTKTIKNNELKSYFSSTFSPASKYIVQQAIDSKTYKGKKFDFRVFTQKTKTGNWKVTGLYARIAGKCPSVTNRDQGGDVKVNVKQMISKKTKGEIKKAAVKAAKAIEQKYPEIIDLGLDIAVDQNENVWLIEANFRPYRSTVDSRQYRILFEHAVWYYKNR